MIPPKVQHHPTSGLLIGWNIVICSRDNTHQMLIHKDEKLSNHIKWFNTTFNTKATEIKLKPVFKPN